MVAFRGTQWIARVLLPFLLLVSPVSPVMSEEIWFAPPDDLPRGAKIMNEDFSELWTAPQNWSFTAAHISVFQLNPYYAAVASQEKLKAIAAILNSKHIKLAVGLQSLPVEGCGQGVEGMTKAGSPGGIARRLKKFGIDVAYFGLDEPLFYGSTYKGRAACKYSVEEVAHRLAGTIADLRSAYPEVRIVQYEPPTDQPLSEWVTTLQRWLSSYRAETGELPYAFVLDSHWDRPWQQANAASVRILHDQGIKAGMFLDAAGGPQVTDESWMAAAKRNADAVLAAKLNLDLVIVASWMMHPSRNVPETDPLSLSALVPWYLKRRSEVH